MGEHCLQWKQALPREVSDDKVYEILQKGRELLKRLSGGAEDIQFRHVIEDKVATIGGPLGQKVNVTYIQLYARFTQTDFLLPKETQGLLKQYRDGQLERDLREAAAKAYADQRAEMEKKVREEAHNRPDVVRDFPQLVDHAPAAGVPLDKMVISDAEVVRLAETPSGVSIFDGPMVPGSDGEVH